jgi:hypothetical protein
MFARRKSIVSLGHIPMLEYSFMPQRKGGTERLNQDKGHTHQRFSQIG